MPESPSRYRLGLLLGDGIGPEIMPVTARIIDAGMAAAAQSAIEWVDLPVGFEAIERDGVALSDATIDALTSCDGWLLGPIDFAAYPGEERTKTNPSGILRKRFDLYANIRPARQFRVDGGSPGTDLIIVRENTEGFYADRNMFSGAGDLSITADVRVVIGVFTRAAINRVAHVACQLAIGRRRHVTAVHKANVLPRAMGLWLDECKAVASEYDVHFDHLHADAAAAHLVRRPGDFDVLVMENLLGDIFSDLMGELTGSLGLAPSLNVGRDHAMAQAAHGSAPDIAGNNTANPVGEVLSAAMLMEWLSDRHDDPMLRRVVTAISHGLAATIVDGISTPDMGGTATTSGFGDAVVARLINHVSQP